eukprot:COSAG04_NODE_6276_length_1367_cov_1.229495_2_plen_126_part_00
MRAQPAEEKKHASSPHDSREEQQRQLIAAEERSKAALETAAQKKAEFDSKKGYIYNLAVEAAGPQPDAEPEPDKAEADPDAAADTTLETKPRNTEEAASKGLGKQAAGLAGLVGAVAMYWLSAAH